MNLNLSRRAKQLWGPGDQAGKRFEFAIKLKEYRRLKQTAVGFINLEKVKKSEKIEMLEN